jgi:4-hydroxy-tetrahydrodipicolinate synthase
MITAAQLRGCYPAVITPMKETGGEIKVDFYHFYKVIEQVVEAGCSGLVIAGTTGQSATVTHSEHIELVTRGADYARGHAQKLGRKIQVIGSAGSNSTNEALYLMREIQRETKLDAFLHVTGYYNNPPQEGLIKHYRTVADLAAEYDTAVVMYNVPSRTKSNIEAATAIELAKQPAIIAVKEASGDLEQVKRIIDGTRGMDFTVVSGEDDQVAAIMKMGGSGVISASANRWPREFQVLTELALAGEHDKAAELQAALLPCVRATFSVKNPIPLAYMFGTKVRLPLVTISELAPETQAKAIATINAALAIDEFPHVENLAAARR